jgi:hypothetical protein
MSLTLEWVMPVACDQAVIPIIAIVNSTASIVVVARTAVERMDSTKFSGATYFVHKVAGQENGQTRNLVQVCSFFLHYSG